MKTRLLFILMMFIASSAFTQNHSDKSNGIYRFGKKYESSIDYYNKRIDTIVDLSIYEFESIANFPLTEFYNKVDFYKTKFHFRTIFQQAKFHSEARFSEANFDLSNTFKGAKFNDEAWFNNCKFKSETNFHYCYFGSLADFNNSIFNSSINFSDTYFGNLASFSHCIFDSITTFYGAVLYWTDFDSTIFKSKVTFNFAYFHNLAKFQGVSFNSIVNFCSTRFDSVADFSNSTFNSKSDFQAAILPQYLNLNRVQVKQDELDLTESIINRKYGICKINLINTDIDKIRLRYDMFELFFTDSIGTDIKASVYEKLLKRQKEDGFTKSYEKLDKEYREFQYLESGKYSPFWGKVRNWIAKNWWGYGYDKGLIFRNTGLIFLFFLVINWRFFSWISLTIYEIPKLSETAKAIQVKNSFCRFMKRFPIAVFYTALIFFGIKFTLENLKYKENLAGFKVFNLIYFFAIYLTGLICLAYMANYVLSN